MTTIKTMNMDAMTEEGRAELTAIWNVRPWHWNGNHIIDMSDQLIQLVLGWPSLPQPIRTILESPHESPDDGTCALNDTPSTGVAPTFAMWRDHDNKIDITELSEACKNIFSSERRGESRDFITLFGGWGYRMCVTWPRARAGDAIFTVLSRDVGACNRCLVLKVKRTGGVITSYLDYVNFCFDGDEDRCFDPNTTQSRSKVIMRMADLINRLSNVQYCETQDAQFFGDDFYRGSVYTMLRKGTTFYETFGFIFGPEEGVAPPNSIRAMNKLLETHTDTKQLFLTVMDMTPADVLMHLDSGRVILAPHASDTKKRPRSLEDRKEPYRVLIPSRASKIIPSGTWYLAAGASVPDLAVEHQIMESDATVFEVTRTTSTVASLQAAFQDEPVFILACGVKAPMSLLQCIGTNVIADERTIRLAVVMDRLYARWESRLTRLEQGQTLRESMQTSPRNSDLDEIFAAMFSLHGSIKYYRTAEGRVVKGADDYKLAVFDSCYNIARARQSLHKRHKLEIKS